jgi:broad specificity phosphatase PhoE
MLQARQTAILSHARRVDRISSSPLRRAVETAEVIGGRLGLAIDVEESFVEIDLGRLEGRRIPNCAISEFEGAIRRKRQTGEMVSWGYRGHLFGARAEVAPDQGLQRRRGCGRIHRLSATGVL